MLMDFITTCGVRDGKAFVCRQTYLFYIHTFIHKQKVYRHFCFDVVKKKFIVLFYVCPVNKILVFHMHFYVQIILSHNDLVRSLTHFGLFLDFSVSYLT